MFKYLVCPDPGYNSVDKTSIRFVQDTGSQERNIKDLNKAIYEVAKFCYEGVIHVFELKTLSKKIADPVYQKYKINDKGELIPYE